MRGPARGPAADAHVVRPPAQALSRSCFLRRDFISTLQRKIAITAVSPSALRGQARPGLITAIRHSLSTAPLKPFGVASSKLFAARLDGLTQRLCRCLGRPHIDWGVGRKAANLFLREAFYNVYLRHRYRLELAEQHYEVPLDGKVAERLLESADHQLPKWMGVKYLSPATSELYQAEAIVQAARLGLARVHLDLYLWLDPPPAAA